MKLSYNWLKQYINCDYPAEKVSEALTSTGLEVEDMTLYESVKGSLKGVVVGKVLSCVAHPNSDHLHITKVDIGNGEPLNIVCGAPNVAEGQKVLVATIGTDLYFGDEKITIKKGKLRGEPSEGMICAEDELQLGKSHDGIMVLPDSYEVGKPASFYFPVEEDYTIEIGLTANRSDATSHIGSARDLVACLNQREKTDKYHLIIPDTSNFKVDNHNLDIDVVVDDTADCPRYSGVTVSNVHVGESPKWLKNRLEACGIRSINNVVDITNFVLMETGQPLHAFDAAKIKGNRIVVRRATEGSKFVTLDGVERTMAATNLMICNAEEAMCIAGVFGGKDSGVTEATTDIFIESAYFDPTSVRKTAKMHGLQTDASFRYERGADPNITIYALKRAAMLVKEIAGGEVSSEIKDVVNGDFAPVRISLSFDYLNRMAGKEIDKTQAVTILQSLDCNIIEKDEAHVVVSVPTCKTDVYRPADLVEEILRIYGYDNIETPMHVHASLNVTAKPDADKMQQRVSDLLANNGFYEIMNNSLTRSAYCNEIDGFDESRNVRILNPLSSDLDVMRQTLLWGGLRSIAYNQNRKVADMKFFEFGNVYFYDKSKPQTAENPLNPYSEKYCLSLLLTGNRNTAAWNDPNPAAFDFYDIKHYVKGIIAKFNIDTNLLEMSEAEEPYCDYSASYAYKGTKLAIMGKISRKTLKAFDIKKDVYYADLDWAALIGVLSANQKISFEQLPKFPSVRRDLALVIDKGVRFEDIRKTALATESKLIAEIGLFDIYEGDKIPEGKKQYAVSFVLTDPQRTLTDKIIDKTMARIQSALEQQLGAKLR